MSYLNRITDILLKERLEAFGAVLIEGPKWCGKTTTAEQVCKSVIRLNDTDMQEEYIVTAMSKPSLLLLGETPRLIDEWQDAPVLWDAVRTMVDKRQVPGQFVLTGSNTVDKTKIKHTGTGRISRIKMLPMSLWETKESNGKISLQKLFDDVNIDIDGIKSDMQIEDLIFAACRGGWPATTNMRSKKAKLLVARNYVESLCREDISRVDGVQRDERVARLILKSYARNISTLAKKSLMNADVVSSGEVNCSQPTFDEYVYAFTRLFVIDDLNAWCPAIRSKTAIRSGVKRAFSDPSIAVAALGLTPESLITQLKTFGFIFEQMCVRDLKAYTPDFGSHISYYRDRYGLEADLVLHLADGRYALIECKLGSREIEEGAKHLLEIKRLIIEKNKTEKQMPIREPDILIILTGGQMAYTRPDGVKVIPLACLKD
ncbi:ATP-binding protein [Sodaliphilus sp.]|uniref:ATP-binding protein n=1 Tax=Sodaliphilus sp. TaxID=2815818 RepID=UPI00389038B3